MMGPAMTGPAMTGPAMIRLAFAAMLGIAAVPAQAGQDVPPPRPIRPVEAALVSGAPAYAVAPRWRETPPVLDRWSSDRIIPVVYGDWADDEDFADADYGAWEDM